MHVSVVIPAKNEEGSIGRCLESLTSQIDAGDEVIVLDNGSTDQTAEIAASFEGVRVIDAPDDRLGGDVHFRGLSQLRQFGAESATNEIVATTDADTIPPEDWIDRIKTHFEQDDDLSVLWGVVTDTNGVPVRNMTGKYLTFLGGVSGCNTAFRKADFDSLQKGYVGWPMFEDVALVTRLARVGKAKHDTSMRMESDLDRRRYQTIPMVATSGVGIASGALVGGPLGALAAGTGVGVGGTELFYELAHEQMPETPFHHDQVGFALIIGALIVDGTVGVAAGGAGVGMLAHHVLSEGVSAAPTDLMLNTDQVCELEPQDGTVEIVCEPQRDLESSVTRILAAATAGAIAGKGAQLVLG